MARLIVEEAGRRRAFRLSTGRLTIGSGEAAALRLASPDVAEIHAELELAGDTLTLRPRPGVAPPRIGTRSVTGPSPLPAGVPLAIGSARLWVELEESERATPAGHAPGGPARGATPAGHAPGRPARGARSSRSAARRSRPRAKRRGLPTWAILAITSVVLVLVALALVRFAEEASEPAFDLASSVARIEASRNERDFAGALRELDRVDARPDIDPAWRATLAEWRAEIEGYVSAARVAVYNQSGTEYLETQVRRFEREYLMKSGAPDPSRVRVLLKRIDHFQETWPEHPELASVARMEERYALIVSLDDPPGFTDIEFEVESLTWANPRDYERAFAVLDEFIADSTGSDREQAIALLDGLTLERQDYFAERIAKSKYHWDQGEDLEAVKWLVSLVVSIGDPVMANDAARRLIQIPKFRSYLQGYERDRPDTYRELLANPVIAEFAAQL